jgi:hypothetical protein
MRVLALAAAAATLAVATPATATIILIDPSSVQGSNVLFNDGVQTNTTVTGFTQAGTLVNFSGATVGGGTTIRANGGQARIEGSLDGSTPGPNDTLALQNLTFALASGTFTDLELNLFNGGGSAGTVDFVITDDGGQIFNFAGLTIDSGENRFGFTGIDGQSIANVSFSSSAGIADVRQVRLSESQMTSAVPEPATWAFMLLGFGAVGFSARRKRHSILQLA